MRLYSYAHLAVFSSLPLPELRVTGERDAAPTLFVSLHEAPFRKPSMEQWAHHWPDPSGQPTLSLALIEGGFLLRFPGLADFAVSDEASRIAARVLDGTNEETLRHLLLDQVLPRVLAHRGDLVLHASSISIAGQIVAFIADTGQGKSTLAGSFHAAGHAMLADDGLVLTSSESACLAHPLYRGLRLHPSSLSALPLDSPALSPMAHYSEKRRVHLSDEGSPGSERNELAPAPLAAVYVLEPEDDLAEDGAVKARPLPKRDACIALIRHAFQLDVTDSGRAARLFGLAAAVAERVPVFALRYPRRFSSLPHVRATILERLGGAEISQAPRQAPAETGD